MSDLNISDDLKYTLQSAFPNDITKGDAECFFCELPTERKTVIESSVGVYKVYECLDCRYKRVKKKVDAGLRPASDLDEANLPENRRY